MNSSVSRKYAIIAFGDIDGVNAKLSSDQIFNGLFANKTWYTARPTRAIAVGTKLLFYENGRGFRGFAEVRNVVDSNAKALLGRATFTVFSTQLMLDQCCVFAEPFNPRTIVRSLDFITNKTFWGQSFRTTPRNISERDYLIIISHAQSEKAP